MGARAKADARGAVRARSIGLPAAVAAAWAVASPATLGGGLARAHDDVGGDREVFWSRVAHPHRARYRALLKDGRSLLDQQNYTAALVPLERAVELEPRLAEGHYWLGLAYSGALRWAECADALLRAQALDPAFTPPEDPARRDVQMGLCLTMSGRLEEAIPYYRRVLVSAAKGSPYAMIGHWNLGDCFMALGRLEEAIGEYRRAVELAPQAAILHFALGVAYDRDEQAARAVEEVAQGIRLDPTVTLSSMQSSPPYGRVLFVPPEDEEYYRGLAHKVAGRRLHAIVHFRRFLELAPASPWVARAREHLRELGSAALADLDVDVKGVPAAARGAYVRPVLAAASRLGRCVEGERSARLVVQIVVSAPPSGGKLVGKSRDKEGPPPPAVHVVNGGPAEVPQAALDCVHAAVLGLRLPVPRTGVATVSFSLVAP